MNVLKQHSTRDRGVAIWLATQPQNLEVAAKQNTRDYIIAQPHSHSQFQIA